MSLRNQDQLMSQPCAFKLKDFEKPTPSTPQKIKKVIQKTDANGNPLFKTIDVETLKGCGCGGKKKEKVIIQKQVPDTEELMVEEVVVPEDNKLVLCKLFGTVKRSHCENCKTYKAKQV
jgi:hypothetical protein